MADSGSVTYWIGRLKAGDRDVACSRLWAGYFGRLVGLARSHLIGRPGRHEDAEDVALNAFDSFVRAAAAGRFPRLDDRDDLWRLLLTITWRKAARLVARAARPGTGGRRVRLFSEMAEEVPGAQSPVEALAREPDPAEAAAVADACRNLLALLGEATLQSVAAWKLEGYTNREIADRLGLKEKTIERKLKLIRQTWEEGLPGR